MRDLKQQSESTLQMYGRKQFQAEGAAKEMMRSLLRKPEDL